MSLILGILDSGGAVAGAAGSYESIATVTVGSGGAGTITFSSIPQTYTHLQVRAISRDSIAGTGGYVANVLPNGATPNYFHWILGDGGTVTAASGAGVIYSGPISPTAGNTANTFGTGVIDILDYANTNKNKTFRSLFGFDANGIGQIYFASGLYSSTSAITSLTFSSNNFVQYSQFALYGIKGA
jgi:hypothetical protein